MSDTNRRLLDASIAHQVALLRYGNRVARDLVALLNAADDELLAFLARRLRVALAAPPNTQRELIARLYADLEAINAAAWEDVEAGLIGAMAGLVVAEESWQSRLLGAAVGAAVAVELSRDQREAALGRYVLGRTLEEQTVDLAAARLRRIEEAIGGAASTGTPWAEAVAAIEGKPLTVSRDALETVAKTDVVAIAGDTRRLVSEESGVVRLEYWSSVLDDKTCFAAGTMVQLSHHVAAPIETIKPGQLIYSGCGRQRRVRGVLRRTSSDWRIVTLTTGEAIRCTATHQLWTERGWRAAGAIRQGDRLGAVSDLRRLGASEQRQPAADLLLSALPSEARRSRQAGHMAGATSRVPPLRRGVSPQDGDQEVLQPPLLSPGARLDRRRADLQAMRREVPGAAQPGAAYREQASGLLQRPVQTGRVGVEGAGLGSMPAVRRGFLRACEASGYGALLFDGVPTPPQDRFMPGMRGGHGGAGALHQEVLLFGLLSAKSPRHAHGAHGEHGTRVPWLSVQAGGADRALVDRLPYRGSTGARARRHLLARQAPQHGGQGLSHPRGWLLPNPPPCGLPDERLAPTCTSDTEPRPQGWVAVVSVAASSETAPCFDLEVEGDHSYLVGASAIIAHNTAVCRANSGATRPIGERLWRRVDGGTYDGDWPAHWGERSVIVDLVEPEVPNILTFAEWLEQQPEAVQRDILGPSRWELWRSGRVALGRFVDEAGNTLTLSELAAA